MAQCPLRTLVAVLRPQSTDNLRKTQKDDNLLKTEGILKSKYKLSRGLFLHLAGQGSHIAPHPSFQLLNCNKHFKYLLNKNDQCLKPSLQLINIKASNL